MKQSLHYKCLFCNSGALAYVFSKFIPVLPASSRPKLDTLSAGEVKSLCFQYNSKMHNAFSSITAVIALEVLKAT